MIDLNDVGDGLHEALAAAAAAGPLADSVAGGTIVLRYADVDALAHDPSLEGVGLVLFDLLGIVDGPLRDWYGGLMFTNEGPTHHRLRQLVSRAFTPRSVASLREQAADLTREALAPMVGGEGDLVEALARVPIRVMCRLIGVPDADVEVFGGWADALSPTFGFMDDVQITAATEAIAGLLDYCTHLADARRGVPADDLITALLAAEADGERLTHDELVAMVANLIVGGHDTTASQIACTLLTLVRHPDAAAALRADPTMIAGGVLETLRYEPSISAVPRVATAPIEVAGTELPAGSLLLLSTMAANREPGVWREPERVDVGRFADPATPKLLTFGAGAHYCLGAALARLTVEEVVGGVLAISDALEPIEDPRELPWRNVLGRAPARLPVRCA